MVADSLRRIEELKEMQAAEAVDSDAGLPDDTDDVDDELEVRLTLSFFPSFLTFSLC